MPNATQPKPAANAAATAKPNVASGPRNAAKLNAINRANTKAGPKIFIGFRAFNAASVSPVSRCHAFPNSTGEYHNPPTRNVAAAVASIARKFNFAGSIPSI